jgi:hypothetical protein
MISKLLGRSGHHKKVVREILIVARQSSGIETSVLSYGGTSISTGARQMPHSGMLTRTVCLEKETEFDRIWPIPDLQFFIYLYISKHLKVQNINLNWDLSSAGEHMTEDHGVPGSTPGGPIFPCIKRFIKQKKLIIM